tara:strand:+ start:68 stop:454 length:387 start_codon:yes stop_codon:yes gene_type:complete
MKNNETLPTIIEHEENLPAVPLDNEGPTDQDVNDDYEKVRDNLNNVSEVGTEALDSALELATETEHPRAFEVVGQIMKTLTDTNLAMLDIHQKVKDIKKKNVADGGDKTTNNLVLTTTDLQKLLTGKA